MGLLRRLGRALVREVVHNALGVDHLTLLQNQGTPNNSSMCWKIHSPDEFGCRSVTYTRDPTRADYGSSKDSQRKGKLRSYLGVSKSMRTSPFWTSSSGTETCYMRRSNWSILTSAIISKIIPSVYAKKRSTSLTLSNGDFRLQVKKKNSGRNKF